MVSAAVRGPRAARAPSPRPVPPGAGRHRARVRAAVGLVVLVALAAAGRALHAAVGGLPLPVTTLLLSMAVGALLARAPRTRHVDPPAEVPLAVGMILLGVQFEAGTFARIGPGGVAALLAHWAVVGALFAGATRWRWLPPRDAGVLAVGLTGCGLSAVLSVVRGDPAAPHHARTTAVATTLAAGALGFSTMPWLGPAAGLSGEGLARWASTSLPTTAESVLVAAPHGPAALQLAGAWRFLVNALQWAPILVYLAVFAPRAAGPGGVRGALARVPAFTWGLAAAGALGVAGVFGAGERLALARLVNWAFLAALAGVGLRTRLGPLVRGGGRAVLVALLLWAVASAVALVVVRATAPPPASVRAAAWHNHRMPAPTADDLPLASRTSEAWAVAALADPAALLDDHAHLERKAAANALALLTRTPADAGSEARTAWTRALAAVARDETEHLGLVLRLLARRGGAPSPMHRNPYASDLRRLVRAGAGREELLDHLLVSALIEARSCERFEVLEAVARGRDPELAALFRGLTASERGHHRLFLELADTVVPPATARARWAELLVEEARVLAAQRPGCRIHAGEPPA